MEQHIKIHFTDISDKDKINTDENKLSCKICKMTFLRKSNLTVHMSKTHNVTNQMCFNVSKEDVVQKSALGEDMKIQTDVLNNATIHIDEKRLSCEICKKTFLRKSNLTVHMSKTHNVTNQMYSNDFKENYFQKSALGEDMKIQTGVSNNSKILIDEEKLSCKICKMTFLRKSNLTVHMSKTHNVTNQMYFDVSKEDFVQKSALGEVMKIQAGVLYNAKNNIDEKSLSCEICKMTFLRKSNLTVHMSKTHNVANPMSFDVSKKDFSPKSALGEDMKIQTGVSNNAKIHTDENRLSCEICKKTFLRKSNLTVHMSKTHNVTNPMSFNVSKEDFIPKSALGEDMKIQTNVRLSCDICKQTFSRKSNLTVHMSKSHNVTRPIYCIVCKEDFLQKSSLEEHMKIHMDVIDHEKMNTGEKRHSCRTCNKKFFRKSNLIVHMRTHYLASPVYCRFCKTEFFQKHALDQHMRRHTDLNTCSCKICRRTFTKDIHLFSHMKKHTRLVVKQFPCTVCEKKFERQSAMNIHLGVHLGVTTKPKITGHRFSCDVCQRVCSSLHAKNKHMRLHSGRNLHICFICGKIFLRRWSLKQHVKIHMGKNSFSCEFCEKKFCSQSSKTQHMQVHTGQKPFCCRFCMKAFAYKHHMVRHVKLHTGEKPFSCTFCKKTFSYNCQLLKHSNVHTCENLVFCIVCKKIYRQYNRKDHNDPKNVMMTSSRDTKFTCNACKLKKKIHKFKNPICALSHVPVIGNNSSPKELIVCHLYRMTIPFSEDKTRKVKIHSCKSLYFCKLCMKFTTENMHLSQSKRLISLLMGSGKSENIHSVCVGENTIPKGMISPQVGSGTRENIPYVSAVDKVISRGPISMVSDSEISENISSVSVRSKDLKKAFLTQNRTIHSCENDASVSIGKKAIPTEHVDDGDSCATAGKETPLDIGMPSAVSSPKEDTEPICSGREASSSEMTRQLGNEGRNASVCVSENVRAHTPTDDCLTSWEYTMTKMQNETFSCEMCGKVSSKGLFISDAVSDTVLCDECQYAPIPCSLCNDMVDLPDLRLHLGQHTGYEAIVN